MAIDTLKNLAYGVVLLPPTPPHLGTTLTLASGHGARFPAAPFSISVWPFGVPADPTNCEICRCTAKTVDALTIQRVQEGSQQRTILAGDQVAQALTNKWITDLVADYKAYTDSAIATFKLYVDNADTNVKAAALLRAPRSWNIATAATPVITDINVYDEVFVYSQATPLTIGNPTGTAAEGQSLVIRLYGGAVQPLTFGSAFASGCSVPLPTSMPAFKTLALGFRYNGVSTKWAMLALAQEP
jgi:hypothetical protein